MKVDISVVVPAYNVELYLAECLDSLRYQTFKNIEIIVVDDGSTDRTGEIIDEYAELDDKIVAIHKKNGGVVSARAVGISQAKGEYIGFVDADDYVSTEMYSKLYTVAMEYGLDAVLNQSLYRLRDGKVSAGTEGVQAGIYRMQDNSIEKLYENIWNENNNSGLLTTMSLGIYKKEFVESIHKEIPLGMKRYEDTLFELLMVTMVNSIGILNEPMYYYRITDGSAMNSINDKQLQDIYYLWEIAKRHYIRHKYETVLMRAFSTLDYICNVGFELYKGKFV